MRNLQLRSLLLRDIRQSFLFSSNDRALQIETCEENKIYYAVAAGTLDQEQFEKYKTDEYFLGQVGLSMDTEYEAGVEMGKFFCR